MVVTHFGWLAAAQADQSEVIDLRGRASCALPHRPARTFLSIVGCSWLVLLAAFGNAANAVEADADHESFSALRAYVQQLGASPQEAGNYHSPDVARSDITDPAYDALRAFAERLGSSQPTSLKGQPKFAEAATPHNAGDSYHSSDVARSDITDSTYDALRAFAERLGPSQPTSLKGQPKFAEANSLMEAWQQMFKGGGVRTAPVPQRGPLAGGTSPSIPVDAHNVGAKVCATCHAGSADHYYRTLMGRLAKTKAGLDCESCHGPGSAHVKAGGGRGMAIISFRPDDLSRTAQENNGICLTCHERGDRTYWSGSTHDTRGLMCTNCHTVMKQVSRKNNLATPFEPDTCYACHKDRKAETFFSSHMGARQGKITCANCHNAHGSATEAMLKENSVNDNCYKCHAEKRGPFLWEHFPVRENCLSCHEAHGSTKQALLKVQPSKLCGECHGFNHGSANPLGPVSSRFQFNKGCVNCHSKVHGSNHPSGTYFLR